MLTFLFIFSFCVFVIIGAAWLQTVVAFQIKSRLGKLLVFLLLLCPGYLVLMLSQIMRDSWSRQMNVLCFCSLVWMLWLVCYALPLDILRLLAIWRNWRLKDWLTWKKIFFISLAAVAVSTVIGYNQAFKIRVKEYDIYSERVPAEFDGYRVMLLSDLHFGTYGSGRIVRIVADIIRNTPNLGVVIHAGDMLDSKNIPDVTEHCNILREAAANVRDGIYGVNGNHDVYATWENTKRYHRQAGITLLGKFAGNGDSAILHDWLQLSGIDYIISHEQSAPPSNPDCFNILVKHLPGQPPNMTDVDYQLMLSGHTHGGQMFPFNFFVNFINRHRTSKLYYNPDGCSYYICQGTGFWGPPLRFFIPAEAVIFNLRSKSGQQSTANSQQ